MMSHGSSHPAAAAACTLDMSRTPRSTPVPRQVGSPHVRVRVAHSTNSLSGPSRL